MASQVATGQPGVASRETGDHQAGEEHAEPRSRKECAIAWEQIEQARRFAERHLFDEQANREKPARTEQRLELIGGYEKGDQADDADAALEKQARQPIASAIDTGHTSPRYCSQSPMIFTNTRFGRRPSNSP